MKTDCVYTCHTKCVHSVSSRDALQELRTDSKLFKELYKGTPGGVQPTGWPRSQWRNSDLSYLKQLQINISLAHQD